VALTRAQIVVLRHAQEKTVYGFNNSPHKDLPYRGAPARRVIKLLREKGFLNNEGRITLTGKGALLISPEATSERIEPVCVHGYKLSELKDDGTVTCDVCSFGEVQVHE
jgi:hypothetical protein